MSTTNSYNVMVCGVDCHPGDANCNGYCKGLIDHPPQATKEQRVEFTDAKIDRLIAELSAAFNYRKEIARG